MLRLKRKKILLTVGPTREYIDSVRFLSNASSGKMGLALARCLAQEGADVFLVCGPGVLVEGKMPFVQVVSARQMLQQVEKKFDWCDVFISVAAVADFRPVLSKRSKIKKEAMPPVLKLVRNPDILARVAKRKTKQFCVGFSLEDHKNALAIAQKKMQRKRCDAMVLNHTWAMESDTNQLTLLLADGSLQKLPRQSKMRSAAALCKILIPLFQ